MDRFRLTPQELIQNSFSPMVAVLCSASVDSIVQKNNLNFVELLQPFCQLTSEGILKDPSGTQCVVKNLRLIIKDVNTKPPQPTIARKLLNDAVGMNYNDSATTVKIGNHTIEVSAATPWFEAWRDTYLKVQFPSDHEFTKHYLACLLVGTTNDAGPAETYSQMLHQLTELQSTVPPKLPKWFNNSVLRCYVLLHDISSGNKEKAIRSFESLKQAYGAGNCFLLCINSKTNDADSESLQTNLWSDYVTRNIESDLSSGRGSLPRTPVDVRPVSSLPSKLSSGSGDESSTPPSAVTPPESSSHPLSPADEVDTLIIDNANSLQITGASEASENIITGYINTNVWDTSVAVNSPAGEYGGYLTKQDVDNIKAFVNDFAFKALLPYFERQISQLHEAAANRKGVSRSLLNATKRWFGTNKPGTNTNAIIYTGDCPELQLRRLGDLWFMLGQWNNAFQVYHTAKREFNADGAWLCYAGALEMAALSAFMNNEPSRKTYDYMEESIVMYLTTCRMVPYAVRATLLSSQCLWSRGLHGEVAKQLIRMTAEDSDLRSALLLEQAARCFVAGPRPMVRKHAFHMVLAGHRYSKAGQRKHALRCYKLAFQVYEHCGWRLAVDHVQYARGRLGAQLRRGADAAAALAAPLAPGSPQAAAQQAALLREYMAAHQLWMESSSDYQTKLPIVALPLLMSNDTVILCGGVAPLSSPGRIPASGATLQSGAIQENETLDSGEPADNSLDERCWSRLEEMLLHTARGSLPMIFKPTVTLYNSCTNNNARPVIPKGEPVQVLVYLQNPLKVDLNLMDVQLLWSFQLENLDGLVQSVTNETYIASKIDITNPIVVTQRLNYMLLEGSSTKSVSLSVTPLHTGDLTLLGVAFKIASALEGNEDSSHSIVIAGKQIFNIKGPKLKTTKDTDQEQYGVDRRLQILVNPPAPCLQVTFSEIPSELLGGELQKVSVELRNAGPEAASSLLMAVSHPECISLESNNETDEQNGSEPFQALYEEKCRGQALGLDERQIRSLCEARWRRRHVWRVCPRLAGGASHHITLWLRAPSACNRSRLHVLFYYEGAGATTSAQLPRHRLLRHTWNLHVKESVNITALPRRTLSLSHENTSRESLILALELKNLSQVPNGPASIQIQALEASLLSQNWQLSNVVPVTDKNKVLASGEQMHLVLQATHVTINDSDSTTFPLYHSGLKLDNVQPETKACISESPFCMFVTDFVSPFDENSFSIDWNNYKKYHESGINSTIIVRWKSKIMTDKGNHRIAVGQHYLWLESFNKKVSSRNEVAEAITVPEGPTLRLFGQERTEVNALKNKDQNDANMVIYRTEHSPEVTHDFHKSQICSIPVKVHLVNCLKRMVVAAVDMSTACDGAGASCVGWAGAVGGRRGGVRVTLAPQGRAQLHVRALLAAPGTYLLGSHFRLISKVLTPEDQAPFIKQTFVSTSLLTVRQT